MTWFFDRGDETTICETRRTPDAYEIIVHHPDGSCGVRTLQTPRALIDELTVIPNELIQQQWRPRFVRVLP